MIWSLLDAVLAISSTCFAAGFVAPRSECYTMDDHNYLYDFVSLLSDISFQKAL